MLQNKEKVNIDWHSQVKAVGKEALLLLLFISSVFLLLSLLSYSTNDPGWRQAQLSAPIANLGGRVGAFIADISFSLFGYMAYLLALIPIVRFFQRLKGIDVQYGMLGWTWRFSGMLMVLISGAILSHLFDVAEHLPAGAGGAMGSVISVPLAESFGFIGAVLIACLVFVLGLTISSDIDWLATLDRIGRITLQAIEWVKAKINKKEDASDIEANINTGASRLVTPEIPVLDPESSLADKVKSPFKAALDAVKKPVEVNSEDVGLADTSLQAEQITTAVKPRRSLASKRKSSVTADTEESPESKKLKIQPFEKKSKGSVGAQGNLFDGSELPSLNLLNRQVGEQSTGYSPEQLENMSRLLEQKLKDFGVKIEVVAVSPGPVITRFEIQPAAGVKASKISNLAKDLARSLAMVSVRVVEVIPGKSVMGLEIPNENRAMVFLGDVLASKEYQELTSPLAFGLGHDIAGDPVTADLAKMPHLLVAGTTGSGKSVGVNSMLISMLYKATPEDLRLIMVDPKMLELSVYDGIPHLLTPVITDMKEAANGLRWCVGEMERRYKLMAALGVRNIAGYNKKVLEAQAKGEPIKDPLWKADESFDEYQPELGKLPYVVVVIDEFADMMMIVGKKVEELIARIAQKARAAGIHLILATQRPSVDIITGLIKANVPTRMAFQVSSRIDSRTILDQGGAEQLLGHGDMLYLPPGTSIPVRVHGAFVDDDEVHAVVADWKTRGEPDFIDAITDGDSSVVVPGFTSENEDPEADALFDEAIAFVTETRKVSISSVQRKLRIGYNRAARLVEAMEQAGVVSTPSQNGSREVLAPPPVAS